MIDDTSQVSSRTLRFDDGCRFLARLPEVHSLHLMGGLRCTDAGLEQLGRLARCRALRRLLAGHQMLRGLDLTGCKRISDRAIPALAKMRLLKSVWLRGTDVTPAGRAALQKSRPGVHVPV